MGDVTALIMATESTFIADISWDSSTNNGDENDPSLTLDTNLSLEYCKHQQNSLLHTRHLFLHSTISFPRLQMQI